VARQPPRRSARELNIGNNHLEVIILEGTMATDHRGARHDLEYRSIPNAARVAAQRWPDAEALVEGSERWTFADLEQRMLRSVRAVMALGVRPGDRVAIWGPNSAHWILAALGIQGAGASVIPLNTRFKMGEVLDILTRIEAKAVFSVGEFLGTDYLGVLEEVSPRLDFELRVIALEEVGREDVLDWQYFLEGGDRVEKSASERAVAAVAPDDLSDIMFTSGTTGSPKGVELTHGQTLRTFGCLNSTRGYTPGDRHLIIPPFFHSLGYKSGWVSDLIFGVTSLPEPVFDADRVLRRIQAENISIVTGPPTIFIDLINHPQRDAFDLSSLRIAVPTAASVPPEVYDKVQAVLGADIVVSGYGLTEATAVVSTTSPVDDFADIANTVGRPIDGVEVKVVDEAGEALGPSQAGEILVRGYNVMGGYWSDQAATAEVIDRDGWLHTGDIGTVDERGYLAITDRKKDMVIVGGFNAYPAEIERFLMLQADIAEAAVVGVPDPRLGEVAFAFVTAAPGRRPNADAVIQAARETMANFKVPRYVKLVESLPRNASMKVLKGDLREKARESIREEGQGRFA
jgi:acyl-CoA synthetase (AMP-forming)/AMP-acid ligase II